MEPNKYCVEVRGSESATLGPLIVCRDRWPSPQEGKKERKEGSKEKERQAEKRKSGLFKTGTDTAFCRESVIPIAPSTPFFVPRLIQRADRIRIQEALSAFLKVHYQIFAV